MEKNLVKRPCREPITTEEANKDLWLEHKLAWSLQDKETGHNDFWCTCGYGDCICICEDCQEESMRWMMENKEY